MVLAYFFFKILLLAKLRAKNQSLSISGCGISNFQGKKVKKKKKMLICRK